MCCRFGRRGIIIFDFEQLAADMGDLREDAVLCTVGAVAAEAPEYAQTVLDALSKGMDIIGDRFENSEYFVGDLIYAGELFTESLERLKAVFPLEPSGRGAGEKVILATVEGDFHDIGKNIVKSVLQSHGFHVIDLGVDVSPAVIAARRRRRGGDRRAFRGPEFFSGLDAADREGV